MKFSDDRAILEAHFATLHLASNASLSEVKAAYRQLARRFHPDLNPNYADATERFKSINVAYEAISQYLNDRIQEPPKKYVECDRVPVESNEIYNSFVDAFMGNTRR
ncbi:chaperone protein DnaJ [Leptolyngbya sp. NIES-3755]|nr:chaperone protein DnaJ [Leptolyngbya sp. NIES-3755]